MSDSDEVGFDPVEATGSEVVSQGTTEPNQFIGLMGHFYRGELSRTVSWRQRLDRTTNWAIVVTATLVTFSFSNRDSSHAVLLLGILTVGFFLLVEARRYRMYDVWRSRVRLLEENVLAHALDRRGLEHTRWRHLLSDDLRVPKVKMPLHEAVARRLRRIYLPILMILLIAWVARIAWLRDVAHTVPEAAAVGVVPGAIILGAVAALYIGLVLLAVWPIPRRAKGQLRKDDMRGDWRNGRS